MLLLCAAEPVSEGLKPWLGLCQRPLGHLLVLPAACCLLLAAVRRRGRNSGSGPASGDGASSGLDPWAGRQIRLHHHVGKNMA